MVEDERCQIFFIRQAYLGYPRTGPHNFVRANLKQVSNRTQRKEYICLAMLR